MTENYNDEEIELINNINSYDLLQVLRTKKLSFNFVINYILNEKYQLTRKEKNITIETVINYQPHLKDQFMEILNNK